jgi:hypothetical protein
MYGTAQSAQIVVGLHEAVLKDFDLLGEDFDERLQGAAQLFGLQSGEHLLLQRGQRLGSSEKLLERGEIRGIEPAARLDCELGVADAIDRRQETVDLIQVEAH